ncbi:helix-turn-helix domain-containing protein [Streptomyces griseus]|uniref:helix-turn-helix domain-containing protein n=1 Tax=Streptomyces griseus TaxID=1911 RepID=UPI0013613AD7|nr:helix-turn-helix domain-containing protein [Streptomyces sp. SID724]
MALWSDCSTSSWTRRSAEDLAHRAGVSRDTVQRIEHATNNPRLTGLLLVARALETEPADLLEKRFTDPGSKPPANDSR